MKYKKGDTLIEVTLAVGIFSMVAIAIVSVMSGGISGAQTALETTLTREEVDAQAEALRFIHSSYVAAKSTSNKELPIVKLWENITKNAIDFESKNWTSKEAQERVTVFAPTTDKDDPNNHFTSCKSLYDTSANDFNANMFIINTRKLGSDIGNAYVSHNSSQFQEASTYPRLIFGGTSEINQENTDLTYSGTSTSLYRAEGIYIIAVRDYGTTAIANNDPTEVSATKDKSAFYDFYIRTCWYSNDAEEPSTISTVIRLYDPDAATIPKSVAPDYHIKNKDAVIAKIDGRTFTKTNAGGAYVGYACHTYPEGQGDFSNKSFVGPVLVSKNQDAVAYTTAGQPFTSTGSFAYKGYTYYYGSWENWMRVNSCADASSVITDAVGKTNKIYTWDGQNVTGTDAIKNAAERLLQDLIK